MSHHSHQAASFTHTQKALHWAVVALLLLQYLFFDGMGRPLREKIETGIATFSFTVVAHIVIGVTVLVLAVWRIRLRMTHGAPTAPGSEPGWARTLARISLILMYVMLIGLPIGGMIGWFTSSEAIAGLHALGTNVLLALILLHVGAVLVHQFIWKTGLLSRMI